VIEAAVVAHGRIERTLAGVTERRMAKIMRKRKRLGQILIQTKRAGHGAGDLRNFEAMSEPRPIMIAFVINEDLRFVSQSAKGRGMKNAVAVALEGCSRGTLRLWKEPPAREAGINGVRDKAAPSQPFWRQHRVRPRID
jgi:hypothetical protein